LKILGWRRLAQRRPGLRGSRSGGLPHSDFPARPRVCDTS